MSTKASLAENYINGQWCSQNQLETMPVIQPATGECIDSLIMSRSTEVDLAVAAAKQAFAEFQFSTKQQRLQLFDNLIECYRESLEPMAQAVTKEMGAPITMSRDRQAMVGLKLLESMRNTLEHMSFEDSIGVTKIWKQPIGVAGMITPWNWPMNQVVCKVSAALAAGCTMVLKPSEYAPYSARLFAEIVGQAGLPAGVFNLVQGGAEAGAALASHPDVDIISITGSVRAGAAVAQAAAPSVKRVAQELGGKSPFLVLPDADIYAAANSCLNRLLVNTGQSCNAPTRLLVPKSAYEPILSIIHSSITNFTVGDPSLETTQVGPLVNSNQFERVNAYIQKGIDEGAKLLCGGVSDLQSQQGFFVKPTVFYEVTEDMSIFKDEIFGPVLCVVAYEDFDHALEIANDTCFGLSAYVYGSDQVLLLEAAKRINAGMVHVNDAIPAFDAPFGGYKQSGNGRERGTFGVEEYLETKSVFTA